MRTLSETKPEQRRHRGWRVCALAAAARRRAASSSRGEDGFLLIEVIVSALMVGLIVIATFTGFDLASKTSAMQRARSEATLLAAQSQEQLRSEPAAALNALESNPHSYTKTVGGNTYTVTQEAKPVGSGGTTTGCSVTSGSAQTAANFQTTSTVTWPTQAKHKPTPLPPVVATAIITPPTGSGIEVDVVNGSGEGVAGVTARATYTPVGSGAQNTIEGTSGTPGCIVLTGIQSTSATVEIVEKTGFVTPSGAIKVKPKELSIAPTLTTHYEVKYAEAGRIAAHFTYKGSTSWEGLTVKSDTFLAGNGENMKVLPEYEIGSTAFGACEGGEELFKPLPGTYLATAETAACSRYPRGDLFPFSNPWVVYGGDCTANKDSEGEASGLVVSGATTNINVPLSYINTSAYTGANSESPGSPTAEILGPVKITNGGCASAGAPNNAWGFSYIHEQKETLPAGHLSNPFQPFGKLTVCLVDQHLTPVKTYTFAANNATVAGTEQKIYLGQKTVTQQAEQRTAQQAALEKVANEETAATKAEETRTKEETEATKAKEKRATEETEATKAKEKRATEETEATIAKEKRATAESEMAAAKTARETTEAAERATWKKQKEEGKITEAQRTTKINTQTTNRTSKESAEATAKATRASEETAATKAKETRAGEETAAIAAKAKRASEETAAIAAAKKRAEEKAAAPAAKAAREKLKKELEAAKKATEEEEAKENASKVTVEAKSTC